MNFTTASDRRLSRRRRSDLFALVLRGSDLAELAAAVAVLVSGAVIITATDGRERAASLDEPPDLREALKRQRLVDASGRLRVEHITDAGVSFGDGTLHKLRIQGTDTDLGWLVCHLSQATLAPPLRETLDQACTAAGLLISRLAAVALVERKYRGDFLRDVFVGRAGPDHSITAHAAGLQWKFSFPCLLIASEIDEAEDDVQPEVLRRHWQERFGRAWEEVISRSEPHAPSADLAPTVVALTGVPAEAPRQYLESRVAALVSQVAGDRGGGRRTFSTGVSAVLHGLEDLPKGFSQATHALEVGRRVHGPASVAHFDQLGVHRLLAVVSTEDLRTFVSDALGELSEDTTLAAELRDSLRALITTNYNVAEAARLQYFHYNTMRYRVARLERALGALTKDASLRLNVAIALQAFDVLARARTPDTTARGGSAAEH